MNGFMRREAPKAFDLHQKLKICLGNRRSASHSKSNLNHELASIAGGNVGFTTDLGCRYRCTAGNAEALLLNEEAVQKVAKLRTTDNVEALDTILTDTDSNETIVQASIPLLLYRLTLDKLHATFSGRAEYGLVRAQLNETKDTLAEAVSKVNSFSKSYHQVVFRLAKSKT